MALTKITPRKFPRFPTNLACLYRYQGAFQWTEGELINMSQGGVCLKAKSPPAKSIEIEIEVELLNKEGDLKKRRMKAKVMWRRGSRAGLIFLKSIKA